jgi:carbamate kinase
VVVDPDDPAFERPTKPIGPVYGSQDVGALADRFGWALAPEASGTGGWRRVVPSPAPQSVVEVDAIGVLLDAGVMVVCAGGGGVPVAPDGERLVGVEAVVDKDATSALLAEQLAADQLLLLTDVDAVVDGWGTPDARPIGQVAAAELAAGDFAAGSMGPKVAAACTFTQRTGRPSAIGSLDQLDAVIAGSAGTRIVP